MGAGSTYLENGKAGMIAEYLEDRQRTCAIEVWQKALGEPGRPKKWQASEIINIILSLPGWERMKSPGRFGEYGLQKEFQKMSANSNKNVYQVYTKPDGNGIPTNKKAGGFILVDSESQMELPFD